MKKLNTLINYLQKIADNNYISKILNWEMDTKAPSKSFDDLIRIKTEVELKSFKLSTSPTLKKILEDVLNDEEFISLSNEEQIYIKDLYEEFLRTQNIPSNFFVEYSTLVSKSQNAWVEAKNQNDYNHFKPYLIKIINMTKQYYEYMYPESTNIYDSMLNTYEKGLTSKEIDKLFNELKTEIIPLVNNLNTNDFKVPEEEYNNDELEKISTYLLDYIGFDNTRGTLGIFPHGYTVKMNNNDTRIAFSNKANIYDHICTIIHEGGHGIFEQNINQNLSKYPTYNIDKYALHESQSRFYENILGRNKNFWIPIYNDFQKKYHLKTTLDQFINILNNAHPSYIRTEADELTYCLHIIIRYEIERDLFNGKIDPNIEDLPAIWNKKTKEYLNLEVKNDNDGILQDVHWSQGSFGYFPSYLIGSILDGMILENIENNLGDINHLLKEGRIKEITTYLNKTIHSYGGAYSSIEVAKRISNEEINVKPIVKYFKEKYSSKKIKEQE